MSETLDWFPGTRNGQLAKAKAWGHVLASSSPPPFGVPQTEVDSFAALTTQADNTLEPAKSGERTPAATARCKEAFDALTADMRDIKRRSFLSPPFTDSDSLALGPNPPDSTHTPSSIPTDQVKVETYRKGGGIENKQHDGSHEMRRS